MDWQISVFCTFIYLVFGICAAAVASNDQRLRDIVLLHFLFGPVVFAVVILVGIFQFAAWSAKFLAGAWSDFRGRF